MTPVSGRLVANSMDETLTYDICTIEMKSTEQYLTILLNKTILFSPASKILICDYSNERYAEQYFPTVLFVPLQHVVLSLNRSY